MFPIQYDNLIKILCFANDEFVALSFYLLLTITYPFSLNRSNKSLVISRVIKLDIVIYVRILSYYFIVCYYGDATFNLPEGDEAEAAAAAAVIRKKAAEAKCWLCC